MSEETQELSVGATVKITYAGYSVSVEVISIGEKEVKCRWFGDNGTLHEAVFPKEKAVMPPKMPRLYQN